MESERLMELELRKEEKRRAAKSKKSTRESSIETDLRLGVEAKGGECYKWVSPGQVGVPDRIVLMPQQPAIFVETKAPDGVLKSWQQRCHQRIEAMGNRVETIWTPAQVTRFLRSL